MDITLKQAVDLFLFDRDTYCAPTTMQNYKNTVKYFVNYMEERKTLTSEQLKMSDITKDDIKAYMIYLRSKPCMLDHPYRRTQERPITKTSVRSYTRDIKVFYHYLHKDGYLEVDPMLNIKLIENEKKLVLPLYENEVKQIDNLYNGKTEVGSRNLCIVHLMLDAGLRAGEVCNLKLADVDLDHGHLFIRNAKGSKDRIVPLAKNLKQLLHCYITLYRCHTDTPYLLINLKSGEQLTQDAIKCMFLRVRQRTGITRLKPHLLRHTFATSYIICGGDLESLRIYLGHTSYEITKNYLHLATTYQLMQADVYRLDKSLFNRYRDTFNR